MNTLRLDLRHALRVLANSPGFTLAAVATLGFCTLRTSRSSASERFCPAVPDARLEHLVMVWEKRRKARPDHHSR
jgi:hypothetical protein